MKRYEPRHCPRCGRNVQLTFFGLYRRHFATDASGKRRLCAGSGRKAVSPAEPEASLRRRS